MAKYYQDFVGLNVLIYEPNGWDITEQRDIYGTGITGQEDVHIQLQGLDLGVLGLGVSQNIIGWTGVSQTNPYRTSGELESLKYKNFRTRTGPYASAPSLALPNSASIFPALMLHRNGPYGFPTWKQIRIGQNPLTRKQRQNNIFTIVDPVGPEFEFKQGNETRRGRARFGSILKYSECPLVSKYDPITLFGASVGNKNEQGAFRVKVQSSLGNETSYFDNQSLNKKLGLVKAGSANYNKMAELYLNGGLKSADSPIDLVEAVKYKEGIYPPLLYTYKNYTRQRTTFVFPWRDKRELRTETVVKKLGILEDLIVGGTATKRHVSQSMWPMDACENFKTRAVSNNVLAKQRWNNDYGFDRIGFPAGNAGILQNHYTIGSEHLTGAISNRTISDFIRPAPIYNRKHLLRNYASITAPDGMEIKDVNDTDANRRLVANQFNGTPGGEAFWDAPAQSGKAPFFDSYDDYIQGAKQLGKDYTIIPEFRISTHVEKYQRNGLDVLNPNFLEITGGLSNTTGSNQTNFYKVYSNTDFLENFKMVREQHKDIIDPVNIKLTCKAIKKLLPYEGFYPQQRTVEIADQFFKSYKTQTSYKVMPDEDFSSYQFSHLSSSAYNFQNLLTPIAAPGVLFNSIKSGVACDFPILSSSIGLEHQTIHKDAQGEYYISITDPGLLSSLTFPANSISPATLWSKRIPFEAMVEPEKHLAGLEICRMEPHINANTSGSAIWSGQGDNLFKLMSHNFLAETSNFFMKNKNYTTLYSKPNNNPGVGLAQAGFSYTMRLKMYKSMDTNVVGSDTGAEWQTPQTNSGSSARENFTMYSRPSAFGPEVFVSGTKDQGGSPARHTQINSKTGINHCFTPPYYYGEAWCHIEFKPTETRKYSIQEIIAQSTASYWRHISQATRDGEIVPGTLMGGFTDAAHTVRSSKNETVNKNALQLSASVNIFGLERDEKGDLNEETARWVIQTKWETPMLNFNHLSESSAVTLPNNVSQSVPRGMWHQYGNIEQDPSKGIFLQIQDIPQDFVEVCLGTTTATTASLADLVGFSSDPVRLGEIADSKEIREAVVAVPFIEEAGEQKFFTLPREDINLALDPDRNNRVGVSVKQMVEKMQRYVFPPSMDFVTNDVIDPIAMYIFEFSHVLSKQDLADIWQGLYPDVTAKMEEAEASISHNLLAHELIGGGAVRVSENDELFLDQGAKGNEFNDRLKWMVFKVKQKAEINYFNNIVTRGGDDFPGAISTSTGVNVNVSYNWPYDFFSLVELGKLEAEVTLAKFKNQGKKALLEPVIPEPEPESELEESVESPAEEYAVSTGEALNEEAQSSVMGGVVGATIPDYS